MLGEQSVAVAAGKQVLEKGLRLFSAAQGGKRVDIPERAHDKGVGGHAEVKWWPRNGDAGQTAVITSLMSRHEAR